MVMVMATRMVMAMAMVHGGWGAGRSHGTLELPKGGASTAPPVSSAALRKQRTVGGGC